MSDPFPLPRRVVLGVSVAREIDTPVDIAVTLAASFRADLRCLVIERDDLLAVAALPFARAVGHGGASSPVTAEGISGYFRHLSRRVERALLQRCSSLDVKWSLTRPQGDYGRELLALAETGDVIVLDRGDVEAHREEFAALSRAVLAKAAAIVIPPSSPRPMSKVIAVSEDKAPSGLLRFAGAVAKAMGLASEAISREAFLAGRNEAEVFVIPLSLAERAGGLLPVLGRAGKRSFVILAPNGN